MRIIVAPLYKKYARQYVNLILCVYRLSKCYMPLHLIQAGHRLSRKTSFRDTNGEQITRELSQVQRHEMLIHSRSGQLRNPGSCCDEKTKPVSSTHPLLHCSTIPHSHSLITAGDYHQRRGREWPFLQWPVSGMYQCRQISRYVEYRVAALDQ